MLKVTITTRTRPSTYQALKDISAGRSHFLRKMTFFPLRGKFHNIFLLIFLLLLNFIIIQVLSKHFNATATPLLRSFPRVMEEAVLFSFPPLLADVAFLWIIYVVSKLNAHIAFCQITTCIINYLKRKFLFVLLAWYPRKTSHHRLSPLSLVFDLKSWL